VIPAFPGDVAWDVWVLLDADATWETAGAHVIGWGFTVIDTAERLFAELERLPTARPAPAGSR
jgi:hypothetical protein